MFYSTIGGMKAVLITDVFQSFLMFAAIYCIIIVVVVKAGGIAPIWEAAREGGRINFFVYATFTMLYTQGRRRRRSAMFCSYFQDHSGSEYPEHLVVADHRRRFHLPLAVRCESDASAAAAHMQGSEGIAAGHVAELAHIDAAQSEHMFLRPIALLLLRQMRSSTAAQNSFQRSGSTATSASLSIHVRIIFGFLADHAAVRDRCHGRYAWIAWAFCRRHIFCQPLDGIGRTQLTGGCHT